MPSPEQASDWANFAEAFESAIAQISETKQAGIIAAVSERFAEEMRRYARTNLSVYVERARGLRNADGRRFSLHNADSRGKSSDPYCVVRIKRADGSDGAARLYMYPPPLISIRFAGRRRFCMRARECPAGSRFRASCY